MFPVPPDTLHGAQFDNVQRAFVTFPEPVTCGAVLWLQFIQFPHDLHDNRSITLRVSLNFIKLTS